MRLLRRLAYWRKLSDRHAALSDEQRAVLLLRVLADMSIEDVANALGKRPGAIKALQRRGLAAVKRELARKAVTL